MKLNEALGPPATWWVMGILLILFSANCSLHKKNIEEPVEKEATNNTVEQRDQVAIKADNSFCYVCHLNYDGEELTTDHEQAGIGCAKCHGRSYDHCGDENNITPPEIMYPKVKINPTCMMCHPKHEIRHVADHKMLLESTETIFDSADDNDDQIYCTGCHAEDHRINVRTIRWNKETGELIKE